jgi:hypothetical protein
MNYDTLAIVPENLREPGCVNSILFENTRRLLGVVFSGSASLSLFAGDDDSSWGPSMRLDHGETLQLKIHPSGALSNGTIYESSNFQKLIICTRRRRAGEKDTVTTGIFWDGSATVLETNSKSFFETDRSSAVSCKGIHLFMPSLFTHHDSLHGGVEPGVEPSVSLWPVLDNSNFHALRCGTLSICQPVKLSDGSQSNLMRTACGTSVFVLAGFLLGISIDDYPRLSVETVNPRQFEILSAKMCDQMRKKSGSTHRTLRALASASAVADLLSAEGLLSILSHPFCGAHLPDLLHAPVGFPLLVAFSVRLACYPERYGLYPCASIDSFTNSDIISHFETAWEPLSLSNCGKKRFFALDFMIRIGFKEAQTCASKHSVNNMLIDNLTFWQRAGQRCINNVFGPKAADFSPADSQFGGCPCLTDPLAEAKNRVIQHNFRPAEAAGGADGAFSLTNIAKKRETLLNLLNDVELWARTGRYSGVQISDRNKTRTAAATHDFGGVEEDMPPMQSAIENLLPKTPEAVEPAMDAAAAADATTHINSDYLDPDSICSDAFGTAIETLASACLQGPLCQHGFLTKCFVSAPEVNLSCANCDTKVHVLTATFLASRNSECSRCKRPRCLVCSKSQAHVAMQQPGCKRCQESN